MKKININFYYEHKSAYAFCIKEIKRLQSAFCTDSYTNILPHYTIPSDQNRYISYYLHDAVNDGQSTLKPSTLLTIIILYVSCLLIKH